MCVFCRGERIYQPGDFDRVLYATNNDSSYIMATGGCVDTAYSDEARRIADSMTLHSIAGNKGKWASYRLSDGREVQPYTAYDKRIDAVKGARWDRDTTLYLEIPPDGMQPKEAEAVLKYARFLHSQGWRLPDPDFEYDASMPTYSWDQIANLRHLISGGKEGLYGNSGPSQERYESACTVEAVQGWYSADRAVHWF